LALSGNNLFVSTNSGTVGLYNASTGAAINSSFITGLNSPLGLAISGNNLFVANFGNGTVGEYNATTGAAINPSFITGLSSPVSIAVRPVPPG
jgi:WD40 repeat protein